MVEEVRRQFREIKGILEGKTEPDYARCVQISTLGAQKEIGIPVAAGHHRPHCDRSAVWCAGRHRSADRWTFFRFHFSDFYGQFRRCLGQCQEIRGRRKLWREGSEVHRATVVGDTVGDPFKDTSGPSLNILIKLMSMVAIVMAGLTVSWSLF